MLRTTVIVALVFAASSYGLPLERNELAIMKNDLSLWKTDFSIGSIPIAIDLGWKKGGTISASVSATPSIDNERLPLAAGISTNINDKNKKISYEVAAKILNKITAAVWGSSDEKTVNYLINAYPIRVTNDRIAIGAGIEGQNLKPVLVGAAVSDGQEIVQAQVGLDDSYKPDSVNVAVGADVSNL